MPNRTDAALDVAIQPSTTVSFTPAQLGINAAALAAGGTLSSNWIAVQGARRLSLYVNSTRGFTIHLFGGIGGYRSGTNSFFYNGADTRKAALAAGSYLFTFEVCFDEAMVFLVNADASNAGTVTVAGAAAY